VILLRFVCVLLMLCSARLAWAGWPFYQGVWNLRRENPEAAEASFAAAREHGFRTLQAALWEAEALKLAYLKNGSEKDRAKAIAGFRAVSERAPWLGRSLMQEALL